MQLKYEIWNILPWRSFYIVICITKKNILTRLLHATLQIHLQSNLELFTYLILSSEEIYRRVPLSGDRANTFSERILSTLSGPCSSRDR